MMEGERGLTTSAPSLLTACDEENHEAEETSQVNLDETASVHSSCSKCNSTGSADERTSGADRAVAGPSCVSGHNGGEDDDDDDDVPPYTALFPTNGSNAHTAYYPAPMPNMCSSSISSENMNCLFSPGTVNGSSSLALPVYGSKSNLSDTASAIVPICRICHQPGEGLDILISPCRCAGTLQFIHNTCLMKWLDITSKKSRKPPKCELCHYQYHRHKKFKFNHWRFPKMSRQDKVLHCIFVFNLVIMVSCAIATVMCFLSDKGQISKFPRNKATLTTEEIITLSCGVLFFVSFFIAMSVQIKARRTLYQVFVKFIMQNMEWEIDEYDKSKDQLYSHQREQYQFHEKAMYV